LLLLDVIDALGRKGVSYMIVGAMAAAYHGIVRASRDADVVISLDREDIPVVAESLRTAGFRVRVSKGAPDDPIRQVLVLNDVHGNIVDLLWGVRGMEKGALDRCRTTSLLGSVVRVIGPEDFIAMKISAGSAKDMGDAQGVIDVSGDQLDIPLLKKLTRRYGVAESRKLARLLERQE
jgi:hypothetical protein